MELATDISKRFEWVMIHMGYTKGEFAQALGVSQGVISHISSGRNKPSLELVCSLLQLNKKLNPDWVLFGEGPTFRDQNTSETTIKETLQVLNEARLINEMNNKSLNDKFNELKSIIEKLR